MDAATAARWARTPAGGTSAPAPAPSAPTTPAQPAPRYAPPPARVGFEPEPHRLVGDFLAVARGVALFLGAFSLFNVFAEQARSLDSNLWWIDLRPCPPRVAHAVLAVCGVLLALFALRPALPGPIRTAALAAVTLLLAAATYNTTMFYVLLRRGTIHTTVALPFSAHATACLAVVMIGLRLRPPEGTSFRQAFLAGLTSLFCLVSFPLAQMYCFGHTDYRRSADAIVVFGCRVNSNNRPSWALYDRMKTACDLYRAGLADVLIVSGGPGEGDTHETEAMKELAVAAGIPESHILVDRDGLDTAATVRNTLPVLRDRQLRRVLAVSHFYHLPRIKLTYRRAGLDVFTVPAKETHRLQLLPYYLARETAALWVYYFRTIER